MADKKKWITTDNPAIVFEDTAVGRMKKEVWDMNEAQLDSVLEEYGIPSAPELGVAGTYIQNTPRYNQIQKRHKNDIVFVPIGCTENHGMHANTGLDTFMCSQIVEGVLRYTKKQGRELLCRLSRKLPCAARRSLRLSFRNRCHRVGSPSTSCRAWASSRRNSINMQHRRSNA